MSLKVFLKTSLEAYPDDETPMSNTSSIKSLKACQASRARPRDRVSFAKSEITEIDEDVYLASATQVTQALQSALENMDASEALQTTQRLRVRLGAISAAKLVSGKSLHEATSALGLTRFSEEDMNEFVNTVADYIQLEFVQHTPQRQSSHEGSFECPVEIS